ncbi:hypothetical protein NDU88_004220 [Pleurodeles waltl]|uniref:Uncharacterized protein n=1 Tax=Pleurodeles waltl TaxID=8319 RepID=A0AAV7KX49_PLEWA|nr:hypothetical protein NDU88_004220 [Pleurodeles waltl]
MSEVARALIRSCGCARFQRLRPRLLVAEMDPTGAQRLDGEGGGSGEKQQPKQVKGPPSPSRFSGSEENQQRSSKGPPSPSRFSGSKENQQPSSKVKVTIAGEPLSILRQRGENGGFRVPRWRYPALHQDFFEGGFKGAGVPLSILRQWGEAAAAF